MAGTQKVIGLMSGTSLDGIDAALLLTDGEETVEPGAAITVPYDAATRAVLQAAIQDALEMPRKAQVPAAVREAERISTVAHANAVRALLATAELEPGEVSAIGYHGQTVLHRPEQRRTWQIGDGVKLAQLTGIDVVADLRSADVAAGGQGAPIVPLYHAALLRQAGNVRLPAVVVNIGGVGNDTYVGEDTILAFDTGPGNAPIDDWALAHTGKPIDENGALSRRGKVDEAILTAMLQHAFFARQPPKSLDRMDFTTTPVVGLSAEDGAATLTAFTAAALARAREHLPAPARTWIVCGGGRHNPVLMDGLRKRVGATVLTAEDAGWRGDFIEAEAIAYLAVRSRKGLPLTLPSTTGVPRPMTGGVLYKAP